MLQVSNQYAQNGAAMQQAYLSTLNNTRPAIWTADQSPQTLFTGQQPAQGCSCEGIFESAMQTVMAMFERMMGAMMSLFGQKASATSMEPLMNANTGLEAVGAGLTRPVETTQIEEQESDPSLFDQIGDLVDKGRDFWSSGKDTWGSVKETAGDWWNTATDWAGNAWSAVTDGASAVGDWVSGIYSWFTS